jgi:16S rRNA (cytosine1402-N4)-methyltransferase
MMHVPVLLQPTLEFLNARSGRKFIDGTAGGGGHIQAVLELNPEATVLGIDWDQASLDKLRSKFAEAGLDRRCTLVAGNYRDLDRIAAQESFSPVDGILLDLGFSSLQLDDAARGLSFQADGPLDMRYSSANPLTAAKVINDYSPGDLARIFRTYGEEKFTQPIVKAIIRARGEMPISSTQALSQIISESLPKPVRHKANDSLRRVFQALRIEVNGELENLKAVLPKCLAILKPGGRLVIISFQSLEDRIVKKFFAEQAKDCICPPEFPTCICDKASTMRILTRKPVIADEAETAANPRSKPAKLRAIEKI